MEESNSQKTWIMCPPNVDQVLNIELPFLVMVIKCTHAQCTLQLQLIDKDNVKHLINFSNLEPKKKTNRYGPPTMHLLLEPGWNRVEVDLNHIARIFDSQFLALARLKIHASCRLRRIYFTDRHYDVNEMPLPLYQGFLDYYMLKWGIQNIERSTQTKKTAGKPTMKENVLHPANGFSKLFLKNLQAKSDKIIEEFFSKQSVKSIKDYLEFKRKAKIKPYVIPDGLTASNKNRKRSETSLLDLGEIKKSINLQNTLYEKLNPSNNEKKAKSLLQQSKDGNTFKKEIIKPTVFKVYEYRYPEIMEKKSTSKDDKVPKYFNVNRYKL